MLACVWLGFGEHVGDCQGPCGLPWIVGMILGQIHVPVLPTLGSPLDQLTQAGILQPTVQSETQGLKAM